MTGSIQFGHLINVVDLYLSHGVGGGGYTTTFDWVTIHVLKCFNLNYLK